MAGEDRELTQTRASALGRATAERAAEARVQLEAELGEPITVDHLSADFLIVQRKRGHRHSTDDLLTAWFALDSVAPAAHALDLGTGIGGVGLLWLSASPEARLTCIEAQALSFRLLQENLRINQLDARVRPLHGDLRELALSERFSLVTGSPPYFPAHAGIVSADSQRAHARFELRGDVSDYAAAAARHLAPDGTFVLCFPTPQRERALAGLHRHGFGVVRQRDVVPREGLPALFTLFAARLGATDAPLEPPFVVRDENGEHTEHMHHARARFGFEPQRLRGG